MRYGVSIDRGVAAMDIADWGWWYEENLDTTRLDIKDPYNCVVGLRFGGAYKLGLLALFGPLRSTVLPADYGFAPGHTDRDDPRYSMNAPGDWDVLTQEWRDVIEQLRRTRGRTSGGPGWIAQSPLTTEGMDPRLNGWFLEKDETCTCGGTCEVCRVRELVAA